MNRLPAPETIDLWQWDLDDPLWDQHLHVLNAKEQEQAGGFHGEVLQARYRRCRSLLRLILAGYVEQPADSIAFSYNAYGKPSLATGAIHFNLSHCGNLALLAVSALPVGVDIETSRGRPGIEIDELLDWVCHPAEKQQLRSLAPTPREEAFYRLWTQKEAYCKALGNGLQKTLTAIRFMPLAAGVSKVVDAESSDPALAFVHALTAPSGYLASLCTPLSRPHFRSRLTSCHLSTAEETPGIDGRH